MNVGELKRKLQNCSDDMEIMILEDFKGCDRKRTINYGPRLVPITKEDTENSVDCAGREDELVIVIGYGCY